MFQSVLKRPKLPGKSDRNTHMVMKKLREKLADSGESIWIIALTMVGAAVLMFFAFFKTYPPSAFFATFTVIGGAVILIPLVLRLAREEGQ